MQLGVNQNVKYKGVIYHIQTEDSGVKNPVITTLLFVGGNILGSKKTNYKDILGKENFEELVKTIIKGQHKALLLELKDGRYAPPGAKKEATAAPAPSTPATPSVTPSVTPPVTPTSASIPAAPKARRVDDELFEAPPSHAHQDSGQRRREQDAQIENDIFEVAPSNAPAQAPQGRAPVAEDMSFDEIILSHLSLEKPGTTTQGGGKPHEAKPKPKDDAMDLDDIILSHLSIRKD